MHLSCQLLWVMYFFWYKVISDTLPTKAYTAFCQTQFTKIFYKFSSNDTTLFLRCWFSIWNIISIFQVIKLPECQECQCHSQNPTQTHSELIWYTKKRDTYIPRIISMECFLSVTIKATIKDTTMTQYVISCRISEITS